MYKDVATQDFMSKDTIFTAVETKVSLQNYIKGAWGTADFVSYDGETLNVVDLKYGKGVAVSPEENPQLKLYALGVIDHFDLRQHKGLYVTLTIVQPRIDGVKSWTICCGELLDWAEDYVVPRARMAAKGEGDYRPSREVCRFCRAKPICKGLAEDIFASIQDMPTINTLTLDEVAANLSKSTLIKAWLVSMEEYVKDALLKNKPVPGWKLVEGRSNRKICDSMQAAALLRKAGYPDELTHKMTLFGITDLERLVGKKQLPEILGSTLAKPQGSPTIVESTDPRPAMNIDSITLEAFDNV
jgi:hypothetical protein